MSQKSGLRPLELVEIDVLRAGQRLDNFLFNRLKDLPKSAVYRLLRTGQVRVNKGRAKPQYKLQAGDQVRIPPLRLDAEQAGGPPPVAAEDLVARLRRAILFEDEQVVVLNKPSGLAVHGGSGLQYGLIEILKSSSPDHAGLELVHRLDRGTSGCLLLAKTYPALRALHDLLREHRIEKTYYALLQGRLPRPVVIDAALDRTVRGGERMVGIVADGKSARSLVEPQRYLPGSTLARIRIETGRTHQIRVHCAGLGHALAGDEKYGDREFNRQMRRVGLKRLFLHAGSIRFELDKPYAVHAPMPAELEAILDKLDDKQAISAAGV